MPQRSVGAAAAVGISAKHGAQPSTRCAASGRSRRQRVRSCSSQGTVHQPSKNFDQFPPSRCSSFGRPPVEEFGQGHDTCPSGGSGIGCQVIQCLVDVDPDGSLRAPAPALSVHREGSGQLELASSSSSPQAIWGLAGKKAAACGLCPRLAEAIWRARQQEGALRALKQKPPHSRHQPGVLDRRLMMGPNALAYLGFTSTKSMRAPLTRCPL